MATLPPPALATPPGPDAAETASCVSCGAAVPGRYCPACGERRRMPEEMSARHFLRELADDVLDVDSRAVRSVRYLLARPGFLTLEYIAGRRQAYLGPLRMYLTAFALSLFVGLLVPQASTQQGRSVADGMRKLVHWVAVRRGIADAAAEKAIEQTVAQHVTWLSALIPLVFAVFLFAVFQRRRRWFGEHLVFATHFGTFNFVVALVLIPFQLLAVRFAGPASAVVVSAVALVPMLAYTMLAVRRVYGTGWPGAAGASLGLFVAFSVAQLVTATLALATSVLKIVYFGI